MPTDRRDDLQAFRSFIDEHLAGGGAVPTLPEALDLWEVWNPSDDEERATLLAVREGLDDLNAGSTRSAWDALAELRRKHKIPDKSWPIGGWHQ